MLAKKTTLLVASIISIVLILLAIFVVRNQKIIVKTDKDRYQKTEEIRLKIENYFLQPLCFSSCYPYFLEKKENDQWQRYEYEACQEVDYLSLCIVPYGKKAFALELEKPSEGTYRVAVPVYLGFETKGIFKAEKEFFSNEFFIY